uniref:Fibronectin type-III domain-containing protein n=1 Tax=Glossina pallidipes TaxID=7398 RepID=A0A1A9ZZ85_GLOPL
MGNISIHMRKRKSSVTQVGENGQWDQVSPIQTKSNVTSYQVTELIPFTVYSFRLKAVNKLGISPPSKESYYIVTLREVGEDRLWLVTIEFTTEFSISCLRHTSANVLRYRVEKYVQLLMFSNETKPRASNMNWAGCPLRWQLREESATQARPWIGLMINDEELIYLINAARAQYYRNNLMIITTSS